MGREIKRVALDFDWPLHVPWKGFLSPYRGQDCPACYVDPKRGKAAGFRHGYSKEYEEMKDQVNYLNIVFTDEDVDWLYEQEYRGIHRLSQRWNPETRELEDFRPRITAEELNNDPIHGIFNVKYDLTKEAIIGRLTRAGLPHMCTYCNGKGEIWFNEKIKQLADDFYEKERYEPPEGEGWQVWETVSEGSPVTPVFETAELLVAWLVTHDGYSPVAAKAFCKDGGWVSSIVISGGVVHQDIESVVLQDSTQGAEQ